MKDKGQSPFQNVKVAGRSGSMGQASAAKIAKNIAARRAENARRERCAYCTLMILPEDMQAHVLKLHGDDE